MDNLVNEIVKNGGATLDKDLSSINKDKGYMVSLQGYELVLNNINELKQAIEEYQGIVKSLKNGYIGIWLDSNTNLWYVDVSIYIVGYYKAIEKARNNNQLAIYDLLNNESIYLSSKYYTLYEVVRDNNNNIVDYKIIKQENNRYNEIKEMINVNIKTLKNSIGKSLESAREIGGKWVVVVDVISDRELEA